MAHGTLDLAGGLASLGKGVAALPGVSAIASLRRDEMARMSMKEQQDHLSEGLRKNQ